MKLWIACWTACLCACTAAGSVPLDGSVDEVQETLPAAGQPDRSREDDDSEQASGDAGTEEDDVDAAERGQPTTPAKSAASDRPDVPTNTAAASGACTGQDDLAVIASAGVDALSCEGAVCIARSLTLGAGGAGVGIDASKASSCMQTTAPSLQRLSDGCRECFVEVSLCVPEACVAVLGGMDACRGLPNDSFAACDQTPSIEASCAQCQADSCYDAFVECSGISR